jgi:hypothetical protein
MLLACKSDVPPAIAPTAPPEERLRPARVVERVRTRDELRSFAAQPKRHAGAPGV